MSRKEWIFTWRELKLRRRKWIFTWREYTCIHICIYYYTPLPLNLAYKQATSNNTSPCCFGHCFVPTLRIFWPCFHLRAWVVALSNPSFEPKTHLWRPQAVAPSWEVPSQICAILGQKQPFLAQNSPNKGTKQPNEAKRLLHSRAD